METKASYILVGSFVLALCLAAAGFILWIAKFQFDQEFARYDIFYEGSVTGLTEGSSVRYKGVPVGEVIGISLDEEDPGRVRVTVEIDAKTPLRQSSVATLELLGLAGGLYVLLSTPTLDSPMLAKAPDARHAVIPSRSSSLQQLLEGAPEILDNVNLLLAQVQDLLKAENRAFFGETLANLSKITGAVADQGETIAAVITKADATLGNLQEASAEISNLSQALRQDSRDLLTQANATLVGYEKLAGSVDQAVTGTSENVNDLIADLRKTVKNLSGSSREFTAMLAENREPIRDFTSTGLYELSGLMSELRELIVVLNRITTEVQRDPAQFLFGDQQQGYEAE
jgi:phospholipid/cholesterol/gamma-HCH transport system substrate-binding protein